MDRPQEIYFGDKNTFAIRYRSDYKTGTNDNTWYYAFLHLQLNGQLIGDPDETCSVNTWLHSIELFLKRIRDNNLVHSEFLNKTDDELFELIWKANQFEEDFNSKYSYLPQLDNSVWSKCSFGIDETTDAYLITTTEIENKIKFMWQGWRHPCPANLIDKLFSLTLDKEVVIKTLMDCIKYVSADLSNYKEQK